MRYPAAAICVLLMLATIVLAGCGARFATSYDHPVAADAAAEWKLAGVDVTVPDELVVSEADTYLPRADIVWREDPPGDRKAQVATIVADAARAAAADMHGKRAVRLKIVLARFHALTFKAEALNIKSGVHDVIFTISVLDANSGEILAGPTLVNAAAPALSGAEMVAARARGESQKLHISRHLQKVIAGWLGLGPDPRETFIRIGA
ncbi:MAG: hypothetical protein H6901_00925 [Rhodobacteraceae bacterium]|nr:hypothetical protein [Paracoccaceae bacterium]MCP5340765.1 hypothetical protein [Paracoccaceae bacterium]